MTRRWAAAMISVVLGAVIAGCSNDSADPVTVAASASSRPTPTPSVAAISTAPPTSSAPPAVSSTVSASPDLATSPAWPTTLSPDEIAAARGAIEAYRSYWQVVDLAAAQPGLDWSEEVAQYATGPEQQSLLAALRKLAERGYHTVGNTGISPRVTSAKQGVVAITDCVDKTVADSQDSNGRSVKAPDVPGSYFRHPSTAQVAQLADGRWTVVVTTDDWSQTC